jgi:hypothetical protein
MCVGISPPCSKCGAPARWKQERAAYQRSSQNLLNALTYLQVHVHADCPIKEDLIAILEGRKGNE